MAIINVGDVFEGILLETCRDDEKSVSRPRVRPVQLLPSSMRVEFPRNLREKHPLGTRFRANVKVCQKHWDNGAVKGDPYLVAETKSILVVRDYTPDQIVMAVRKAGSRSGLAYEYVKAQGAAEPSANTFAELRVSAHRFALVELQAVRREAVQRERSALIARYALCRSEGYCEGCGEPAPFLRRNGEPYLEVHHMVAVSSGGADHPSNVAAICPNCHARVTHGSDANGYNRKIKIRVDAKEAQLGTV